MMLWLFVTSCTLISDAEVIGKIAGPPATDTSADAGTDSAADADTGLELDSADTGTRDTAAGLDTADTADACIPGTIATMDGIEFALICAGTFEMGCLDRSPDCEGDETIHTVNLTENYWVAVTEVTQAHFTGMMGYNPSYFGACGNTCPIEGSSWHEAVNYANALSRQAGLTECYACSGTEATSQCAPAFSPYECNGYRLPTEAEWENAARCGETFTYAGSNTMGDVGWYGGTSGNAGDRTHPTRELAPNRCGLYDMSGNVWEWAHDWYGGAFGPEAVTNPFGPNTGTDRVVRGGNWLDVAKASRVDNHANCPPDFRVERFGFRLARGAE